VYAVQDASCQKVLTVGNPARSDEKLLCKVAVDDMLSDREWDDCD